MASQDILLDSTNDLEIANGDFVVGISEQQETNLLINSFIGNWFQYPLVGVGIINYLAGNESATYLEQIIKNQLVNDGFIVQSINIKGTTIDNIVINVEAKR